mmetsp:Transcript_31383/g.64192  ORF Transcript_31383/g.64192 Transcript_31383/m.64192 type:complete len:207 (+) Transcript_31383:212-832(+)
MPHSLLCEQNELLRASSAVALNLGSTVSSILRSAPNPDGLSLSATIPSSGPIFLTCPKLDGLSIPPILCHPLESNTSPFVSARSSMSLGNGPTHRSMRARCSALSCVANSSSPRCSSATMHPADHRSEGVDHPRPSITSGARYWRVFTTDDFFSRSYVAPPKSMTLILVDWGTAWDVPSQFRCRASSFVVRSMFSGLRSVCMSPKE